MGHGDVAAAPGVLSAPSDHAVPFLVQLGEALTQAGEPEGFVQPRVAQMAAAYRVPAARVVVLPKLTLAAAGPGEPVVLDATPATEPDLRLDQRRWCRASRGWRTPRPWIRTTGCARSTTPRPFRIASGRSGSSQGTRRSRSAHA
jgi:hypothetical protein